MSIEHALSALQYYREQLRELAHRDYEAYLRTRHWQRRREHALHHYGPHCHDCKRFDPFPEVHHLSYEHLGNEPLIDLCVLCPGCHGRRHDEPNALVSTIQQRSIERQKTR